MHLGHRRRDDAILLLRALLVIKCVMQLEFLEHLFYKKTGTL